MAIQVKDAPRLMREEKRLSDGTVQGRYGYTDPFGVFRVVKYVSGNGGYYATEEIGEYVTSSTPQYYKATAPQMEDVSEEPISYSTDLATKFNPPLYHPEAHTMAPYERTTASDNSETPEDNRGHRIFSLSNSEDILERKYRERKQLERNMKASLTDNQNPIRATSQPKQILNKRIGQMRPTNYGTPAYRTGFESGDNIRRNIDRNIDNKDIIESLRDNNDNNELLRRAALQRPTANYKSIISDNYSDNATETVISHETLLTNISDSDNRNVSHNEENNNNDNNDNNFNATEKSVESTKKNSEETSASDSFSHLYYNPTRSPISKYSTPITNDQKIEPNETQSDDQKSMWTKLKERFVYGSPTNEPSEPTTTTETPITTAEAVKDIGENSTNYDIFSPIFIRADPEDIKTIPLRISEEEETKFFDKNYFFGYRNLPNNNQDQLNSRLLENNTKDVIDISNETDIFETSNNDYISKVNITADNNFDLGIQVNFTNDNGPSESTAQSSELITTEQPLSTTQLLINDNQQDNFTNDKTQSGFFQDLWIAQIIKDHNLTLVDEVTTEQIPFKWELPSTTTEANVLTTTEFKAKDYQEINNSDKPENVKDFIDEFWQKFDDKSILFSEAQINNQSRSENASNDQNDSSTHWIAQDIDPKFVMISEGVMENVEQGELDRNATEQPQDRQSSEAQTSTSTTTVTPTDSTISVEPETELNSITKNGSVEDGIEREATSTKSPEYLESFWHNFNDNSDEYSQDIANTKKEVDESDDKLNATHERILTLNSGNLTNDYNLLPLDGQDLASVEDKSQNLTAVYERPLPLLQNDEHNQSMPPLSAIFRFPHVRKTIRKVQRFRPPQQASDETHQDRIRTKTEEPTTTASSLESDIMATDATEELEEMTGLDEDSYPLSLTASQRVYHYIPPFHIHRETYINKNFKPDRSTVKRPPQYSVAFDDMSEIMSSIKSMSKRNEQPNEERVSKEQELSESKVKFDDNPDSFMPTQPSDIRFRYQPESGIQRRFHSYLLPIEPYREELPEQSVNKEPEIKRHIHKFKKYFKYEPIIRLDA